MVDFSDWESVEDSAYDSFGVKSDIESRLKAMQKYLEVSQEIEDELVAEMGQEEYDASQHWINNPLISPRSKVVMLEEWEARIRKEENEHIVKLLEIGGPIEQIICDYWGDPEFDKDDALVLIEKAIKGEK